jgi:hypothetical protein
MSKLLEKIRKNTVVDASLLKNSKYFNDGVFITTGVPLLNLAMSGKLDGGLPKGIVQIAAPPKHFKTNFMIEIIKGFQNANIGKDYIVVLYDSELGSTPAYFENAGIDTSKIDHRPVCSVEELSKLVPPLFLGKVSQASVATLFPAAQVCTASGETILAIGSLYLAGEILAHYHGKKLVDHSLQDRLR